MTTELSKQHYFYLWSHRFVEDLSDTVIARICFGITANLDDRRNSYEGHVGHSVVFRDVWSGTERQMRELESRLKTAFQEYLVSGHRNYQYEWVDENIAYETVRNWVEWEVQNTFIEIQKVNVA
jgi:hypothetical protein